MRGRLYVRMGFVLGALVLPLAAALLAVGLFALTDAGTLSLDGSRYWWLWFAVPAAGLLSLYGAIRREQSLTRFVSGNLAPLLAPDLAPWRRGLGAGLFSAALLMAAIAIMGPRWGVYLEERKAYGVDIVVALDVSRSMLAEDMRPSRLELAKRLLRQHLTERTAMRDNRLGLLVFAGNSAMRVPLTLDHGFFRQALDAVQAGSVPRGGTGIAEALYAASDFFDGSPRESGKVILVVTDGEDHEGDAIEAARTVHRDAGARVFAVGVGDPALAAGAQVPAAAGSDRPLLYDGRIVFSRLNEKYLADVAEAGGGGRYVHLQDFGRLVETIAEMDRQELTTELRERRRPRYQWFLVAALILLTVETLSGERRRGPHSMAHRVWEDASH